ncbi:Hypothetical predicted protein [Octopus vulgaris]|uniref:Uncharacterized protein n=1 Tax=Octopus vulgaris TaxID=6645 RepID=A0AA36B656_OCTVU|nr:Hypothetical predicted protein [Octopus vulgaris]
MTCSDVAAEFNHSAYVSQEIMSPAVCDKQLNTDDTQQESKMKIIVNVDSKYIPNTEYVKMNSGSNLKYNSSKFDYKEELLILNVNHLSERKNVFPLHTSQFVSKPKKSNQKTDQRKSLNHRPATTAACFRNFSEVNTPEGNSEHAILHQYLLMIANGTTNIQTNGNSILPPPQQQQQISSMEKCHQGIFCGYEIPSDSKIGVKTSVEGKYVHLQSGHFWLANGRNVFEEQRLLELSNPKSDCLHNP